MACSRLILMVTMLLALCSFLWLAGPECSAFWPVWTRRDSNSGMFIAGIASYSEPRAVFLPFVRPMMLRITAGMHRKDSCPRRTGNWIFWEMTWYFSTTPCIWKSLVRAVCLRSTGLLLFREMTPGMVSVFSTLLGSTAEHVRHQSTTLFGRISHVFYWI